MRVGPKDTGQFTECNDNSNLVSKQCLVKNTAVQFILENNYFRVWVPISEERKLNLRNHT
jgi:hypothetical protein